MKRTTKTTNKSGELWTMLINGQSGRTYRVTVFAMGDEFAKETGIEKPIRDLAVSEFDLEKREWTPLITAGDVESAEIEKWMKENTLLENVARILGEFFGMGSIEADKFTDENSDPAVSDDSDLPF